MNEKCNVCGKYKTDTTITDWYASIPAPICQCIEKETTHIYKFKYCPHCGHEL